MERYGSITFLPFRRGHRACLHFSIATKWIYEGPLLCRLPGRLWTTGETRSWVFLEAEMIESRRNWNWYFFFPHGRLFLSFSIHQSCTRDVRRPGENRNLLFQRSVEPNPSSVVVAFENIFVNTFRYRPSKRSNVCALVLASHEITGHRRFQRFCPIKIDLTFFSYVLFSILLLGSPRHRFFDREKHHSEIYLYTVDESRDVAKGPCTVGTRRNEYGDCLCHRE